MKWFTPLLLTAVLQVNPVWALNALSEQPTPSAEFPPTVVELAITSAGSRMPAHIYLANGRGPHPTIVLMHGLPGNEKNLDIAQALRRTGFNVLFFHYRGAWGAEGEYRLSQLDDDALAVLAYLREPANAEQLRVDTERLSLLGHSMGGFGALAAGSQDDGLVCVGAMSPSNLGIRKRLLTGGDHEGLVGLTSYADELFMLRGLDGRTVLEDLEANPLSSWELANFANGLIGKSVLMVVGDADGVTPADENLLPAAAAYRDAGVSVQRRIIGGDHSFSGNRLGLTREIVTWADGDCR